jgi:hypothetical protein
VLEDKTCWSHGVGRLFGLPDSGWLDCRRPAANRQGLQPLRADVRTGWCGPANDINARILVNGFHGFFFAGGFAFLQAQISFQGGRIDLVFDHE